jgi:hypothetical protein
MEDYLSKIHSNDSWRVSLYVLSRKRRTSLEPEVIIVMDRDPVNRHPLRIGPNPAILNESNDEVPHEWIYRKEIQIIFRLLLDLGIFLVSPGKAPKWHFFKGGPL